MKDNAKNGTGSPGTETLKTDTVATVRDWIAVAVNEKAKRTKKDFRTRACQCVTFHLRNSSERDEIIEMIRNGSLIPADAKTYAYIGHIQTNDLGGLMLCVATKGDMVSAKEMSAQLARHEKLESAPKSSAPRPERSVVDLYRKPSPVGRVVLPDGTLGDWRHVGDGNEMSAELLRITDS